MDGPARAHLQDGQHAHEGSRGDEPERDGIRRGDDDDRHGHRHPHQPGPGNDPVLAPAAGGPPAQAAPVPAAPVPAAPVPAAPSPQIEIGTALGPISGESGAQAHASADPVAATSGTRRAPLLSFDAPSPFAPRSLAGGLRGAPGAGRLQIAIRRGTAARGCGWWNPRTARFSAARRASCASSRWITARMVPVAGGWRWRAALGGPLPDGSYRYLVRVLDAGGRPLVFQRV